MSHYRLEQNTRRRRLANANCALAFYGFTLGFLLMAAVVAHAVISAGIMP